MSEESKEQKEQKEQKEDWSRFVVNEEDFHRARACHGSRPPSERKTIIQTKLNNELESLTKLQKDRDE